MTVKFREFEIGSIGPLVTDRQFGWIPITLYFDDLAVGTQPAVEIRITVQYRKDWTLQQIHEAALAKAKTVLEAASDLLAQHDLEELQRPSRARVSRPMPAKDGPPQS